MRLQAGDCARASVPGRRRALLPAVLLAAALCAAVIGIASAAGASRRPGARVTVALFGDSVTESLLVSNFLQYGLAPQLSRAESSLGFAPGGVGLIPAAPFRWRFNRWVGLGTGPNPPAGWVMIGYGTTPAYDGPSEYSAVTTSPQASATVAVSDPEVKILYSSTNLHCPFSVTGAGQTWTIDTYRPGPPTDTETPLALPAGRNELTIHGPSCGALWFDGAVAQRPVSPAQVQVEVDNLGHSGKLPWDGFTTRVQQSLLERRYDISVFLYGYLGEVVGGKALSTPYLNAVTARARIARANGGACLIVAPTPLPVPRSVVTMVSGLDQTVARRAGCTYTKVLTHLWASPAAAERQGLVVVDGVHPTAAGYKLIAHALSPIVAQIVRTRLGHGSG
ncbi:MAG: SGNH/GDSL hydrolase family protein [Actinomycetota bacterium]|nr:SGNH/GDSL hydrolase family protein [Actinomycetota bacterium]